MKKVLITKTLPSDIAKELLSKKYLVDINEGSVLKKEDLIEAVQKYDGILSLLCDRFDKEVLSYAKNLKVISNFAIGLDNIDQNEAHKKNIKVFNLPDIVTESTADLTFAILLSLIRKIPEAKAYVKKNKWVAYDPTLFMGEELHNKTFGIIGFGRCGKAVAKRALGFGLNVIFYNRSKVDLQDDLKLCKQVSLDDLFKSSDYISLHVPLTEETKHFLFLDTIKQMVKKPVLINMARGGVVNTDDLVYALENKLLRSASLDVTDPEPLTKDHPLLSLENCLVVPHIGSATLECRYQMAKKAAENILSCL